MMILHRLNLLQLVQRLDALDNELFVLADSAEKGEVSDLLDSLRKVRQRAKKNQSAFYARRDLCMQLREFKTLHRRAKRAVVEMVPVLREIGLRLTEIEAPVVVKTK